MTLAHYVFAPTDPSNSFDGDPARADHVPRRLAIDGIHPDTQEDQADGLVARIRTGDEQAFRDLMLQYFDPIVRFVASLTREAETAEDIAQEVFARVWAQRERLDPTRAAKPYLFTSARNHALNAIKHRVAQTKLRTALHVASRARESGMPLAPDDELLQHMSADEAAAAIARLTHAVEALPERRRTALALRFDQGMTFPDVGSVLGISGKAAQQLILRTIVELRRILVP